ncbi:TnsA endonuclease [Rhizobium leguminosarum bv. trifolii WSM2297]|uniref:TnsA endonuclease n=1 Tax=Rhizobium leguminosarum bv. trifolii WSM2297 TaxID=754762 RepID=J0CMM9_RHILT|nr:TnsA endonuclease N-terminal domain-containing protein [Rhizobium leguminosarum]EJC80815.1 TnsA endonuclease [Rhizobium leguminosarum bv. trifolii WSM2297]
MSIHSARLVSARMKMRKAGLGFVHNRKAGIAGMQDSSLRATGSLMAIAASAPKQAEASEDETFYEPTHGLALRSTLRKNASASNGFEFFNGIRVYFDSAIEHRCLLRFMTRHDIAEIHSQALLFHYHDDDEKLHKHTIDYLLIYKDGWKDAIVVKPERKRDEMDDLIERMKAHPSSAQVNGFQFLSETYGTIEAAENADFILWSRDFQIDHEVADLLEIVRTIDGYVRFGDLMRSCHDIDERRVAIWRLIDLGVLFSPTGERITELTYLARNPAQ